jgi:membrane protease YdiL (CAAX protease family)
MFFHETKKHPKTIPLRAHLIHWIGRNELTFFFTLTFIFSWSIYLAIALSQFNNQTVLSRVLLIAGFGPSLSALLISTVNSSKSATPMPGKRVVLFLSVFAFGAAIEWLDHVLWKHQIDTNLIITDAILVTLAAIVISSIYSNRQKVGDMMIPITFWRVGIIWYLIALGLWPLIILVGNVIAHALNMPLSSIPAWPNRTLLIAIAEYFVWFFLFGGPLNEEPGWRGFAMPRLQGLFSPLVASLILGTLWGLWHVPLHLMGFYYGGAWGAIIRVQEIPRAILFTWIYNRTKGSLFLAILFHAAVNTAGFFLPRSFPMILVVCTLTAALVTIKERMWKRLPAEPAS